MRTVKHSIIVSIAVIVVCALSWIVAGCGASASGAQVQRGDSWKNIDNRVEYRCWNGYLLIFNRSTGDIGIAELNEKVPC
jgi:hypothetical protein